MCASFPLIMSKQYHATGYASQHFWCLSIARTKWEGCSRKGIRHKNGGMMKVGHWLVQMEWCPPKWSVILPCTVKVQKISSGTASPGGPGKTAVKRLCMCVHEQTVSCWDGKLTLECPTFIMSNLVKSFKAITAVSISPGSDSGWVQWH